jgi:hypothetical protein
MCPSGELVPQSLPHPSPPPSGAITAPLGTRLARGLPPLPRWSEAITPGVYRVEIPRYPPVTRHGAGGGSTPTPPTATHTNGCK